MRWGVRLAVDIGSVRIGVARSDASGALAVPLEAIRAGGDDLNRVVALVGEWEAIEVIVGLPLHMSGQEGAAAQGARLWAERLADRVDVPVRLVDERLSTVQAQRALQAGGRSTKDSRALIDSASAVMVLQGELDRQARASDGDEGQGR